MTLLAALVGAVALMCAGSMRMGVAAGRRAARSRDGDARATAGRSASILLVLWVVSWVLAPIIVRLLALGVSRDREYLADAMSAQFTRNPMSLATALEKIEHADAPTTSIKSGTAHFCIADPLGRPLNSATGFVANLLGTHPPMAMRVARLKAMAYQEQKRSGSFGAAPDAATA